MATYILSFYCTASIDPVSIIAFGILNNIATIMVFVFEWLIKILQELYRAIDCNCLIVIIWEMKRFMFNVILRCEETIRIIDMLAVCITMDQSACVIIIVIMIVNMLMNNEEWKHVLSLLDQQVTLVCCSHYYYYYHC